MKPIHAALFAGLIASTLAIAQDDDWRHHNITLGVGSAIPVGNATNYLNAAPLLNFSYGYRLNRRFQADVGLQLAFGAANNQNAEVTNFGSVQGGDHEYMVPIGGRVYIPQPFKRFEISAGGGAAYLHYSETVPSGNGDYWLGCYSCTSRGGWGGYGLVNGSYYLDRGHMWRLGTTVQYVAASTNGQAVGNVPALKTTDHWTNVSFEFGFSF